jgi:hypothetical protein
MSWANIPPPIFEDEDELQLKLEYARIVARNERERFTAGYKIFPGPDNYGRALQVAAWYEDPIVQDEITRLRSGGEDANPRDEFANEVLQRFRTAGDRDAAAFGKLYADVKGFVDKGPKVLVDNRVVNVLRVPTRDVTPEDDADFDERFYTQQTALIAAAKSERPAIVQG